MDPAADIAQQVNDLLDRVQRGVDALTVAVNRVLSHVPEVFAWVVDRFMSLWNDFLEKLAEFSAWFVDKLLYVGNPFMLGGAAGGWREAGGVLHNQSRVIDDSALRVDDTWAGSGADQYRQSLPPQRDAFASMSSDFVENIASALEQMRDALVIFWVGVGAAIFIAIVGVATATGEAISILGLPAVPPTAIAAVAGALGALAIAGGQLYVQANGAQDKMNKTSMGIQSWPQIVTS